VNSAKLEKLAARQVETAHLFLSEAGVPLETLALEIASCFTNGQRLCIAGTGRLAPLASYIHALFLHGMRVDRPSLPAVLIEGGVNDAAGFVRILNAVVRSGDCFLLLEDSRQVEAGDLLLQAARENECVNALLGSTDRDAGELVDVPVLLPATELPELAENVMLFGHGLCILVEESLFGF